MIAKMSPIDKAGNTNLRGRLSTVDLLIEVSAESAKANGRELALGRVFNYKLGCSDDVHVIMYTDAHP
jgi:hypothetical protein